MELEDKIRKILEKHLFINDGSGYNPYIDGINESAKEIASLIQPKQDFSEKEIKDMSRKHANTTSIHRSYDCSYYGFYEGFKKCLSLTQLPESLIIEAARYGYNFHKDSQFPKHTFEDACINNVKQKFQGLTTQSDAMEFGKFIHKECQPMYFRGIEKFLYNDKEYTTEQLYKLFKDQKQNG